MKRKFEILSALLMCFILTFTSCVQDDMYEIYDDDMFPDVMISRKKGKWDNYDDVDQVAVAAAIKWINNHPVQSNENECFAYALSNYSGRPISQIRKMVGPKIFYYNMYDWPIYYKAWVTSGAGLPTQYRDDEYWYDFEASIINQTVGASYKSSSVWESEFMQKEGQSLTGNIIVGVNHNHWGVLMKVEYRSGYWMVTLKDQTGSNNVYLFREIDSVYW